ncbi:serine (or cysteine) peptidase inhibitor, clade H, member 2 isoform X1 [Megalobrama amblycephala]|uniref:serine (or cysteine) peptidase inhibitor, clade H, member 2 isoform X1 n=1 Tax=Megalobrama amblycephala TaxID=75352 RepID=UPI002014723F|nr:serine (or cysteine) peptidase inhibitor, clade H, member 2 isoform X1 [Megalobrama amblycephala]XP_048041811.1 serine (or cysteine) peptidase inhibitor, clade H, member 2 isoform X1 [Megalobrama amblycephala]XP_048041812.1 serine (or cysteine) peptidase inhibitor, clade H, member 2 isoform X1 [Megalobrama amblycephala]XP_048041813.1 serine (or cysteine) peptidase inhibitor, clade H, member 2 isoform X1 [Megalobrama amblycephala]XP_048041814.1 serine (or cysteine) peptidase inhibitor, clade 
MLPISPVPLLFLLLLALQSVWSSTPQEPKVQGSPQPEISSLHLPTWSLGLQLYRSLRTDGSKTNTFISPLLLANSLLAVGGGANGSTAGQFHDLLRITKNEKAVGEALTRALKSVFEANGTSYTLHSSSALFSKQAPELEKSFLEKLQTHFGLQHVALEDAQKQTDMEKLQSWAKSGMDGEETAALEQALETKPGAMILANALHFKGFWDRGFYHENQDLRSFLGTKYTKVPMMHRSGVYRHYEDMENMVQVLELGLWEGKASMVLLLPFHVERLARLDRLLTLDQVEKWLGKLNSTSMALSLPRTKMSSMVNLQKQLATLGLVDAWNETSADFSSASSMGQGKLHLGAVLHWTSLELAPESGSIDDMHEDEEVEKPKIFYADHSFIILVRDNSTGALLMIGALDHTDGPAIHDEL